MFDDTLVLVNSVNGVVNDKNFVLVAEQAGQTIRKNSSRSPSDPCSFVITHRTNAKSKTSTIQLAITSTSLDGSSPPVATEARTSLQVTLPASPNTECTDDVAVAILSLIDFFAPYVSRTAYTATRHVQTLDAYAGIQTVLNRLLLGEG